MTGTEGGGGHDEGQRAVPIRLGDWAAACKSYGQYLVLHDSNGNSNELGGLYEELAAYCADHADLMVHVDRGADVQIGAYPSLVRTKATTLHTFITTGHKAWASLVASTPIGVQKLLAIRGITPLKLRLLWKEAGITSPLALLTACEEGKVAALKGFGKASVANLVEDLQFHSAHIGHMRWELAEAQAEAIELLLAASLGASGGAWYRTGAIARKSETVCTLSWAIVATEDEGEGEVGFTEAFIGRLVHALEPLGLVGAGRTSPYRWAGFLPNSGVVDGLEVVFQHSRPQDRVRDELLLSSSATHLQYVHGKQPAFFELLHTEDFASIGTAYAQVGLVEVPVALREGPYIAEQLNAYVPDRLQAADLRGVLHAHSTYSDGQDELRALAVACKGLGYAYLGITDHSQSAFYAHGLQPDRILKQHAEIEALNEELSPFRIFKGIEVDILADGGLDYTEEVLEWFDFTVASVHTGLQMDAEKATTRLLHALSSPYVTILGHWTGRLLAHRRGYDFAVEAVLAACGEHGVAIELNTSPWRLEASWVWMGKIQEAGIKMCLNPDAHSIAGIAYMDKAVDFAGKGLLQKSNTLNTFSTDELDAYFRQKKARR